MTRVQIKPPKGFVEPADFRLRVQALFSLMGRRDVRWNGSVGAFDFEVTDEVAAQLMILREILPWTVSFALVG